MVSSILSVNLREAVKGFFIAFIGAIVFFLKSLFDNGGTIPVTLVEWKAILLKGISAGVMYVIVTFFSGPAAANAKKEKKPE